jgi:hypothetical protein
VPRAVCGRNVIRTHLYWGYKLSRAEELLKVTAVCPTVCNLSCEREDVTLDPNKVTCRACRERAKARSEQERTARKNLFLHGESLVFASALLYRAVPLGAPMGAGLPWPVVCGADVVVFATSVTILLTP